MLSRMWSCRRGALCHAPWHAEASCCKRARAQHAWALPPRSPCSRHEGRKTDSAYLKHDPPPDLRKEGGLMAESKPTTRLQQLIHRTDRVLAVMHAPTAAHPRLMELAGAEVAFVGTAAQ